MEEYKAIIIAIKNEIGATIYSELIATKEEDITDRVIKILKDNDITLLQGDTITIE